MKMPRKFVCKIQEVESAPSDKKGNGYKYISSISKSLVMEDAKEIYDVLVSAKSYREHIQPNCRSKRFFSSVVKID